MPFLFARDLWSFKPEGVLKCMLSCRKKASGRQNLAPVAQVVAWNWAVLQGGEQAFTSLFGWWL
jgi:hypothetical protein